MYFRSYYFSLVHLIAFEKYTFTPRTVADLRKKVANALGHPVYITELPINLRAWGMKIIGSRNKIQYKIRILFSRWGSDVT